MISTLLAAATAVFVSLAGVDTASAYSAAQTGNVATKPVWQEGALQQLTSVLMTATRSEQTAAGRQAASQAVRGTSFDTSTISSKIHTTEFLPEGADLLTGRVGVLSEIGSPAAVETGDGRTEGATVRFSVPNTTTVTSGAGTVTANTPTVAATVIGHTTRRGGQLLYVMNDASADSTFTVDVTASAGTHWVEQANGVLRLVDASGEPLVTVDKPWAIDADGRALSTHYVVDGTTIIQKIDTRGASFPVVADPSWWEWVKNAGTCAAGLAALLVVTAKLASIGVKIYEALSKAKQGTALYRAYVAWEKLGSSNTARAKSLLNALWAFAKKLVSSGLSSAMSMLKNSYGNQYTVLYDATGVIVTFLGIDGCIWLLSQAF